MHISVVQKSKHEATISLDSVTVAEVLRVALYEQGVDFAAWKKEHYSKPVLMIVRHADGVQKIINAAVGQITKQTELLVKELK
jgi:hypothetical protein